MNKCFTYKPSQTALTSALAESRPLGNEGVWSCTSDYSHGKVRLNTLKIGGDWGHRWGKDDLAELHEAAGSRVTNKLYLAVWRIQTKQRMRVCFTLRAKCKAMISHLKHSESAQIHLAVTEVTEDWRKMQIPADLLLHTHGSGKIYFPWDSENVHFPFMPVNQSNK